MPDNKRPKLIDRIAGIGGPDTAPFDFGLAVPASKGLHPFDETYRYANMSNYSGPVTPLWERGWYGGAVDYAVEAGDLIDSSAVMACLNWLMRVFPMSKPRVVLDTGDGLEPIPDHPLTRLLKKPNPYYAGTQLWRATVLSYYWAGNAYWRKVRNGAGQVIALYYEPHWTIRPKRDNAEEFVSSYQIWRDRKWRDTKREDVVHFRWAFAARDQMLGMGTLDSALREVFTDNEAGRYAASMFKNMGVFSRLISPKDGELPLSTTEAARLIAEFQAATTGDNRGRPIIPTVPVDMVEGNSDPSKMDTRGNRRITEERISALLGVPASVVGLGAGLDRNTFSNSEEAVRWAYYNNLIPTQDGMAEELDVQLVSDFTSVDAETVEFSNQNIEVLKGDQTRKDTITLLAWNSDGITYGQLCVRLGYKAPSDGTENMIKSEFTRARGGAPELPNVAGDTLPQDDTTGKALALLANGNGHAMDEALGLLVGARK